MKNLKKIIILLLISNYLVEVHNLTCYATDYQNQLLKLKCKEDEKYCETVRPKGQKGGVKRCSRKCEETEIMGTGGTIQFFCCTTDLCNKAVIKEPLHLKVFFVGALLLNLVKNVFF